MATRQAIAVFAVFAFAYFFSTLIRAITATLAPTLVAEFALNARDLGLLAGGYFLGFAAMQIPLGRWLDRHGPRAVIVAFLALAVAGCIAFSMATSFVGLLAARVLCGVGVCACLMAPLTGYRRWLAPAIQIRANAWMLMVGAFGMVASTLPVQWLLPLVGWRMVFTALAVLVALAMALIWWLVPAWEQAAATAATAKPGYSEVWTHRYFRSLVPIGFFNYGGLVAMQTLWAAPWMVKVTGYTPLEAALGLFWINVAMLVTFWLWGLALPMLARKGYGVERLIALGMPISMLVLAIIILAGPALSTGSSVVWAVFCVSSTLGSLAQPAVGMAFPAELAGRALSAFNLVIFCGVFAVQWGVGLMIDAFQWAGWGLVPAYQGALAVYGLTCIGSYLYFLKAKQP
ncbi:MAG: MFS transporter [Burkholderiales bacterium PBB4]|nr:MAG: MFS transporter [Burkholderiales bacterium PBB4]